MSGASALSAPRRSPHAPFALLLAGDPAFVERALGGDLWAASAPGIVGVLGVAVLVAAGVGAALWLLRDGEPGAAPRTRADAARSDPLAAELDAFAVARRRLEAELAGHPDRAAGSALASLLTGPLEDLDRRVARLQRTLGSCRGDALATEGLRVETEERRLRGLLAAEDDPGARALLEASLRDVAESARMHTGLVRRGRLAQLEVGRLRTLLEALPARLREIAATQALAPGDTTDAEDIARQLALVRGWSVGYMAVIAQLTWSMRPIIRHPSIEEFVLFGGPGGNMFTYFFQEVAKLVH